MTEFYPTDPELLALADDPATGVEYIPTGQTPYHLAFRRTLQRTLLAGERANDLRVFQDGVLTVGIRAGQCTIANVSHSVASITAFAINPSATTYLWIGTDGAIASSTDSFPTDRTSYLPLAEVTADSVEITEIADRRGRAFLLVPDLPTLGVTATAERINAAIADTNGTVDAAAMNLLTAGPTSSADTEHRHEQMLTSSDSETHFTLINDHVGDDANVALAWQVSGHLPDDTLLLLNRDTGFLQQRHDGQTFELVGTTHAQRVHAGTLLATQSNEPIGVVPIAGEITEVSLSIATNLQSDIATDGVAATVKVNSSAVTATDPSLTSDSGAGFRSTAQGDGVSAVVKSDGTESVEKGDILTLDLTRTAAGTISTEAADVVVLVTIRANRPD